MSYLIEKFVDFANDATLNNLLLDKKYRDAGAFNEWNMRDILSLFDTA